MYMSLRSVGVAELRQNLSKHLRRVQRGERLIVTDRNRPVAELGPLHAPPEGTLARLLAEGKATPARARGRWPQPVGIELDPPDALSRALDEVRGER